MPDYVYYRGRWVTRGTQWWWKHTTMSYSELFCAHMVRLSEKCGQCKEGRKSEVQGSA